MSSRPLLTKHAIERARERCGLDQNATERLAARALELGITKEEARGSLKSCFDQHEILNQHGDNVRVYAEKVFVFSGETLLTVMPLRNENKAMARKILKRKQRRQKEAANHDQ